MCSFILKEKEILLLYDCVNTLCLQSAQWMSTRLRLGPIGGQEGLSQVKYSSRGGRVKCFGSYEMAALCVRSVDSFICPAGHL